MSEDVYRKLGQEMTEKYGSISGQMFGKPCLKINKKAYAAFFKGEMVFKLGMKDIDVFRAEYFGSKKWDPSGKNRAMKDWLQVPAQYIDEWPSLAKKALVFVKALSS